MKYIGTAVLFLSLAFSSFGQSFKGTVLDHETKLPLSGAQVRFVELKTETTTDSNGVFQFEYFNQKKLHIQIAMLGYNSIEDLVEVSAEKEKTFYLEYGYFHVEEVVISASLGKLQRDNIVHVDHQKLATLKQTSPLTLAEAISNIPGVEQTTTGSGIGKPVIRGLSGNRIVTYAQGIRIENQQWGSEHGLGVGDVGIESVEVIKGPASLLYGSDALGGVLFFVDDRYASQHTVEAFAQSKFMSNTLGTMSNAGFKLHKGKLKLNLFGAYSSHADYRTADFNRVFNTRFDEKSLKGSLGYNRKNWISNLRYSYLQNNYGISEDAVFTNSTQRSFGLPYQVIDNHNVSLENIFFIGESKLNLTLGSTTNYRKEFEEELDHHALGLKLNTHTYNLKWHAPTFKDKFNLVVGSQGMLQNNKNDGEEILIPDGETTDIGVFMIGRLDLNKLQLQGGIRADNRIIDTKEMHLEHHHEGEEEEEETIIPALKNTYTGYTFSGGAVYNFKHTKLRANISSGFRAPNTTELLSDGVHHGTNRYIKGEQNLQNESATQVDFSFDYRAKHFSFSINPFYNNIQNYIFLSPTDSVIENDPVFEYVQTNAILYGGEVGFHYHPHKFHWLHIESNFSTVFAENSRGEALPLIPQTRLSSTIRSEFSHKGKVRLKNIYVQHIYKFQQNRIGVFETASTDFSLINLGLNLEISNKENPLELSMGLRNLLNTRYIDHLSRFKAMGIPNQGINFYVGLKVKLKKSLKKKGE